MKKMFLTPNKYSRPETPMGEVLAIVIHWAGNAGKPAQHTWNWFEGHQHDKAYGSAHFCIDDVEELYTVPVGEVAYHAGPHSKATFFAKKKFNYQYSNDHSIGLELSHPEWDGIFLPDTIWRAANICASLCIMFHLSPLEDIIRHFDVTGKDCPHWYVDDEEAWEDFKMNTLDLMTVQEEFHA